MLVPSLRMMKKMRGLNIRNHWCSLGTGKSQSQGGEGWGLPAVIDWGLLVSSGMVDVWVRVSLCLNTNDRFFFSHTFFVEGAQSRVTLSHFRI